MASIPDFVYDGILDADGTIHLDHPPDVRPGPVQVAVRPAARDFMLPDLPWPDECVPAPCDLPLLGPREPVTLREVDDWLPDPHDVEEDSE
jgi:hypothetical protein